MATDASPKFQNPDFRQVPQTPDFHPEISVSTHDGLEFWQFMIAGSIAGSVEHMAMFPVDTLKTRMQALGSCPAMSVGLRQALGSILKVEGPSGLYRGIGAMGLGAGPAHAVYFSVYEICKEFFSGGNPNNSAAHAGSGVFATVASDAVITPMDMVKQRLQLESSPYKGVSDCVKRVLREEGFGAFYASYRTTVLMNAPFTATYEATKRGLMEVSPESASDERLIVHASAGAAAGALAAAVTTPLDVVKTQLQCQMDEIAAGLRSNGVPYLWVERGESSRLQEACGEMGLVVPWCDQLRVLSHPSIGGFLTHCGWNSTLEGVFAGVPMLTFPIFMDQAPNSKLIVDDWKVGWRVKTVVGAETLVKREEITRIVKRFMDLEGDASKEMRSRTRELQETCQRAIGKGGSLETNLDAFIKDIL
ncbi:hypothetical protein HHK36_016115 [Tetracentron sinense]|uniref:Glycosyltransferase n=1 Tax=Tetracentron sinense TaxID=13715 RepID=A0A834Z557_TETSI|nr:hypothetical protein HHK36_016115 [Tetracentron sinense]